MIIQQQTDGTWLAEQRVRDTGKLQIAEGRTQQEAWESLIDLISAQLDAQLAAYHNRKGAEA